MGNLWEGRFKSCVVQAEAYLLACMRYIELNPVRAGMVADPGHYRWSSYRHNGLGQPDERLDAHPLYLAMGRESEGRRQAYRALYGNEGNDITIGGAHDDTLYGGEGRDTYIFNPGDGRDTVIDTKADNNIFRFGAGFNPGDVTLGLGSLLLDMGSGDEIHIAGFDQTDIFNSSAIGGFEFADGTYLTINQLLARGFDLDGTEVDDEIVGTNTTDRITGLGGNDQLVGLDGNDVLTGGAGTDSFNGGLGDDTYILAAGDGAALADGTTEAIMDDGGNDTLRITAVRDVFIANGGDLAIDYGETDRVVIVGGIAGAVEHFEVDGEVLSHAQFVGHYASAPLMATAADGTEWLLGGNAADRLVADGQGVVSGGRGADTLFLNSNDALLMYGRSDGTDVVNTVAAGGSGNVLRLDAGIRAADLRLTVGGVGLGSLALQVGTAADDTLHFTAFDRNAALSSRPFERIEFADGGTLSYDDLLAQGFDIAGGAGGDRLRGTSVVDRLAGLAGDDILDGGRGDDVLMGGEGRDTYVLALGGGADRAIEVDGQTNVVRLGNGLGLDALHGRREGDDLVLLTVGTADSLTLEDYYASGASWELQAADGATMGMNAFLIRPGPTAGDELAAVWQATWRVTNNRALAAAASHGWRPLGDNRYETHIDGSGWRVATDETVRTVVYRGTGPGEVLTGDTSYSQRWANWYPNLQLNGETRVDQALATFRPDRVESDDALISGGASGTWASTTSMQLAHMAWSYPRTETGLGNQVWRQTIDGVDYWTYETTSRATTTEYGDADARKNAPPKSRQWWHGEPTATADNDSAWRMVS